MSAEAPAVLRKVRIWLIVETIIAVPIMLVGAMMALFSPMLFDAPGSSSNPPVVLLFVSVVGFIPVCLLGLICAWIAAALRRAQLALWLSLMPFVPLITGGIAIAWLQFGSGGQLGR